jgi:TolB-like protein
MTVLLAGVLLLRERGAAPTPPPIRSLAVLPLENLSGDPGQDYFAGAMTDTLIGELSKLPGVRVISRTSVLQYANARQPLPAIARALSVDGILEGSVFRSGDDVRISARLVDARSDRQLWSERYDRRIERVLEIQSEVARAVASEIELALSPQQVARFAPRMPIDPRAQDAYFRGLAHRVVFSPEGMSRSVAAFEEAIAIAPDYAPAHASLAASLLMLRWTGAPPHETIARARQAAQRAIAADERSGDAHMALGVVLYVYDWDWAGAERALRRGRELGASDPVTRAFAPMLLMTRGRPQEAMAWMDEAVAAAPLDLFVSTQRSALLRLLGRPNEALQEADRILAINPRYGGGLFKRRDALEQLGRLDEVLPLIRSSAEMYPELRVDPSEFEHAWQMQGRVGFWRTIAHFTLAETTHPIYRDPVRAAMAYGQIESFDEAFAALDLAYEQRTESLVTVFVDPLFAPLRADPRFAALARRMNLPAPE